MKLVYLTMAALSLLSIGCSTEGSNHDIQNNMYLNLSDEDNEYYFEGSDVNVSRTFLTDVKKNEGDIEYLSQCTSVLPEGTLDLTVRFIQEINDEDSAPLELTLGTHTNSHISDELMFTFQHTDTNGTVWECCVENDQENIQNKITIQQIEPYHSKIDGTTKRLVTMSFEATMINAEGQLKTLNGHMKSIVEGQLP